jgi:hypothetical protein
MLIPAAPGSLTMFGQTIQGSYRFGGADEPEWILNGRTTTFTGKDEKEPI